MRSTVHRQAAPQLRLWTLLWIAPLLFSPSHTQAQSSTHETQRVFAASFLADELVNWTIEQHVPDGYPDVEAREGNLALLDAGNRILPHIPSLQNLTLSGRFNTDWKHNHGIYSMHLFVGYNAEQRKGHRLAIISDGTELTVSLTHAGKTLATQSSELLESGPIDFELRIRGRKLQLLLNNEELLLHRLPEPIQGTVAVGRGVFTGELRLTRFEITSNDLPPPRTLWKDLRIPFATLNGMDIPIVWSVHAVALGDNIFRVDVDLSGGEKTRKDVPWFPYHGYYAEYLNHPYLRIESLESNHELNLSDNTLALANPSRPIFYDFNKEPSWPFSRSFYLQGLHADSRLVAGYKAYGNRMTNRHLETERPHETIIDSMTGKRIYAGPALRTGTPVLTLQSPPDKATCRRIPTTAVDYEHALAFAQNNHFFDWNEDCRFTFELTSVREIFRHDLEVLYRIESAFFEPIDDFRAVQFEETTQTLTSDILQKKSLELSLGRMDPGVYHVRFQLVLNGRMVEENYRAFEILGKDQSGIEASRLPTLFSMRNETKGIDTDSFDPWRQDTVDVSHYTQISSSIMPHIAGEKRLWELLDVYHRKWFLWNAWRTMEHSDLDHSRELIKHADYVFRRVYKSVFRPSARKYFKGHMLRFLLDYAKQGDFPTEAVQSSLDARTLLDKETYDLLVDEHFYPFIDFLLERYMGELALVQKKVRSINPEAKMSSYGPVPMYIAGYKTAHSVHPQGPYLQGEMLGEVRDGFFIFEDYPYAARYSNQRGPFLVADMKRHSPTVKIYPELYYPHGVIKPNPDAALARAWPSYGLWSSSMQASETILKRVLEYVYSTGSHDGKKFHYWTDHGFHTPNWPRNLYGELLTTWGFIDDHPPRRPLKANAFISNETCVRNHQLYYDEYPGSRYEPYGDLFNTAEECIAFAYEMSRSAGQNAGFVADFSSLESLSADDIDTLILPPLLKVSDKDLANIRRLHEQGVSLLGFEVVEGLEDLFGVQIGHPQQVSSIAVNTNIPGNPLLPLANMTEYTEHRACMGLYETDGADVLLEAEVPVLFSHQTAWGKTALFNIPPTAVRRQSQPHRVQLGRDSISQLINESTRLILRHLSNPVVDTDNGKLIAFEDTHGVTHIIVEEDAHPMPSHTIHPVIRLNMLNLNANKITCSKEFSILHTSPSSIEIGLTLEPDEYAIFSIGR